MAQMTTTDWLNGIQKGLLNQLETNTKALPKGFNRDRFILNCMTVIQDMMKDDKKKAALQKVSYESIPICLAKGAFLGLDFFNGECYAIPYGAAMQFQTDYKGEIKLCKRYSRNEIKDIFAKVVREGDFFEEEISRGVQNIVYKPVPFSNKPMIGAFAVVVFKDGSMMYDTMGKEEIENVRNTYSKASNSQAWTKSTGEMYKKTVLRRLCKLIDLNFDTIEQGLAYIDGGDAEFTNNTSNAKQPSQLPGADTVVDAFARETRSIEEKGQPMTTPQDFHQQTYTEPQQVYSPEYAIPDEMDESEFPWR